MAMTRSTPFLSAVVLLLGLSGCNMEAESANSGSDDGGGRYSGVGTYQADPLWRHVKGAPENQEADSARLDDDSQIIVVVDRQTGEIRQCGNNSGFCVGMNPWTGAAPAAPARLDKHASELANESEPTAIEDNSAQ